MEKEKIINKIQALLHDPPEKAVLLSRRIAHEHRSQKLLEILGIPKEIPEQVKIADRLASACDRTNFPKEAEIKIDFLKEPILIHPLSGKQFWIPETLQNIDEKVVMETVDSAIRKIAEEYKGDLNRIYLSLWRELGDLLQREGNDRDKMGKLWELLPADTRIPDHSIWEHCRVTSAISGALPEPAFLLFQIGPVQDFISTARKTQDLWAGSYLLSWLSWCGMKVVCEKYGPDTVIFPDLLGQPFLDLWLKVKGLKFIDNIEPEKLSSPTLTNRFLAILPADQVGNIAEGAEQSVRKEFSNIGKWVREALEKKLDGKLNCSLSEWKPIWERQISQFLDIYWVGWKWDSSSHGTGKEGLDAFIELYKTLLTPKKDWAFGNFLKAYEKGFPPNIGTAYGSLYKITEKALGSRKTIRNFNQQSEPHFKCTLTGVHEPVHPKTFKDDKGTYDCDEFGGLNRFWQALQKHMEGRIRNGERLGALGLVKRFAPEYFREMLGEISEVLKGESQFETAFPSTSTVSTSSFKQRVIRNMSYVPITVAVQNYVDSVLQLFAERREQVKSELLPQIKRSCKDAGNNRSLAWNFARLDGDWLFEESFDGKVVKRDLGDSFNDDYLRHAIKSLKELKKVISEFDRGRTYQEQIGTPSRYYAVVVMDGDEMGKWLSGENAPKFRDILHPSVWNTLQVEKDWQTLGDEKRSLNPSLHLATSKALRDFSLITARKIIEEKHLGKLIYSGGDDVLAFISLRDLLQVMWELRAFFSGNLKGEKNDICWTDDATGFVKDENSFYLTMGSEASASMGICIAHYSQNLGQVLDTARSNEKHAKGKLDRNAYSIALAKRSGGTEEFGAKWFYKELNLDVVHLLMEWVRLFRQEKGVSSRLVFDFRNESAGLEGLPKEAIQAEMLRLAGRHRSKGVSKEEIDLQVKRLVNLKEAVKSMDDLCKFLSLATFLARGENQ